MSQKIGSAIDRVDVPEATTMGGLSAVHFAHSLGDQGVERRGLLKGFAVLLGGLGLTAMGVFPRVRVALANGKHSVEDFCPSNIPGTCWPGCGPSFASGSYCKTSGGKKGWHKTKTNNTGYYKYKLRPDVCYGGWADAWLWANGSSCSGCSNKDWRCHDGYVKWGTSSYTPTICRYCI